MSEFFDALKAVAETPTKKLIAFAAAVLVALQVSNPKDYFRFGALLILAYVFFTFFIGGLTRFWEQWKNGSAHINRINDPFDGISDLTRCILADFVAKEKNQFFAHPSKLEELGLINFVRKPQREVIALQPGEIPGMVGKSGMFSSNPKPMGVELFEFLPEFWQHLQANKEHLQQSKEASLAALPQADRIIWRHRLEGMESYLALGHEF